MDETKQGVYASRTTNTMMRNTQPFPKTTTLLLLAVLYLTQTCRVKHGCDAFSPIVPAVKRQQAFRNQRRNYRFVVLASSDSASETSDKSSDEIPSGVSNALMPSTDDTAENDDDSSSSPGQPQVVTSNDDILTSPVATTATTAFMITREQKRVLIEELGYTRRDVESMRVDLAGPVISKRQRCPPEGMPESWYKQEDESSSMLERLENESKYPLKFPLLGISLILFGKGLSDAVITLIKVNMGYTGVSLTEEFMGIPVLAIDAVCVAAGMGVGIWTWKTMRD